MLSVNDPRSRTRSKSPGGNRGERSRSRDACAPSPAAPSRRSKVSYASDEEEASDHSRDPRYERDDRRRSGYEVAVRKSKGEEDSFDEEDDYRDKRGGRGGGHERERDGRERGEKEYHREKEYREVRRGEEGKKYEYARPSEYVRHTSSYEGKSGSGGGGGRGEYRDERGYEVPGAFHEQDAGHGGRDRAASGGVSRHMSVNASGDYRHDSVGGQRSPYYSAGSHEEALYRTHSGPGHDNKIQYAAPSKYEYAKPPHEVKYSAANKADASRPRYMAKEAAEIEVERRRHRREDEEERERREYEEEMKHRHRKGGYKVESDSEEEREERRRRRKHEEEKERERDRDRRHVEIEQKRERRPSHSRPEAQVLEITPGGRGGSSLKPIEHGVRRLSVSGGAAGGMLGAGLGAGLAAHGHSHDHHSGGRPPGSPLLESYHGTYQSISPMPSPLALPSTMDDGLSDLEPLEPDFDSDDSRHARPKKSILKKRVEIYDPEPDAKAIAAELKHSKPEAKVLIKILPHLSNDNMMALRTEYKKHFKVQGKGINIAKHIKVKYTGNVGKVAYATALGRWESEAHWANFWYQSGSSRRELLIESLMGRSNLEIRQIKEAFSDKRYNDSIEKCMETELKKDKFRHAVLLALEEKRMDDVASISSRRVKEDVKGLYDALVSTDGGETAMIDIIVVRSDAHLREVLREFEAKYRRNFAREMIQKSKNLVVSNPPPLPFPPFFSFFPISTKTPVLAVPLKDVVTFRVVRLTRWVDGCRARR